MSFNDCCKRLNFCPDFYRGTGSPSLGDMVSPGGISRIPAASRLDFHTGPVTGLSVSELMLHKPNYLLKYSSPFLLLYLLSYEGNAPTGIEPATR